MNDVFNGIMTRDYVVRKVHDAVANIINLNGHGFVATPASVLGDDLNFDELDIVELMLTLEDGLALTLEDDAIAITSSVGDIVELVYSMVRDYPEDAA